MNKYLLLILIVFIFLPMVLALSVNIPINTNSVSINCTTTNVNDSLYWQGHTGTDASWLTGYIEGDSEFYDWLGAGGVCTEGDKCGYFSTCEQLSDPEGCGFITSAGADTWLGNYTFYYNKSQVDNNLSNYILTSSLPLENKTIIHCSNITGSASDLCTIVSGGNSSFNQSLTDLLYANITWNYNQTIGANTYTNSVNNTLASWVSLIFVKITDIVNYVGNWTLDKPNYYNKTQIDNNFSLYYLASNPNNYINTTGDSWTGNYTFYYNKTQVDNNFSLYYLLSNPNNYVNITSISNTTIVRNGNFNCSGSNVVQNITINSSGIFSQCVAVASLSNIFNQVLNTTSNVTFNNLTITKNSNFLENITASWFKGAFNWIVNSVSSKWLTFNGTDLIFNETNLNTTISEEGIRLGFNRTDNATYNNLLNQKCPNGQVVNGTYTNGTFTCITPTAVETDPFAYNGTLAFNSTFDNYYSKSQVFNNTAFNSTQMENSGGYLNILVSWLTSLFYTETEIDSKIINNASYFSTFNQTYADNLVNHTNITFNTYNSTWDNSFMNIWNYNQTTATYNLYNAVWLSTYNSTYATTSIEWNGNKSALLGCINNASYLSTYNSTYASGLGEPAWNGNYSIFTGLINNASYLSTYNITYAGYATNVSINHTLNTYTNWNTVWSATGNSSYILKSGDTMTGNLNFSNSNITNPNSIVMKEISGACDLTINHSICTNLSGMWIIG